MNINSHNITMRDHNKKSKWEDSKSRHEPRETIKTATFVDIWKFKKARETLEELSANKFVESPKFTHTFNDSSIQLSARMHKEDSYGGILIIESIVEGAETDTTKVQCFIRNAKGEEIRLSTSKREDNRFKHVTQPSIVLNEDNGLIPKDVLTLVLKIQVTIRQDYYIVKDKRLADDLSSLLKSGNLSDVTLLVDGESLKAHKAILACRSSAFASIFHDEACVVVEIKNFDVGVVKEILTFCYTGWVEKISVDLLRAGEEFDIVGLKIACEDHLSRNLSVDNAAALLVSAENFRAPTLKKKVTKFVAAHLKEIVNTSMTQFQNISKPTMLEILQMWSAT